MADDETDITDNDNNLTPDGDQTGLNTPSLPEAPPTDNQTVPEDIAGTGADTDEPEDDSPENLDEAASQGDDNARSGPDPDDLPGTTGQGIL